jgi:23S rRNA (adenine2503-C2)-methyltransferase
VTVPAPALSSESSSGPQPFLGLGRQDLEAVCAKEGWPSFRMKQLWRWVYVTGVRSFEAMSSVSKDSRAEWARRWHLDRPRMVCAKASKDGTQKWLVAGDENHEIEVVHIPESTRGTLCLSSQVGCVLNCDFCHTGTQRFVRNLKAWEIVGQVMMARDVFGEWPAFPAPRHVSNLVMMGMGEPLYNYEEVKKALRVIMDPEGLSISRRKITLSTAGVVPVMDQCGQELDVNLAVSLHAVTDDLRDVLVPLNKKYPLKELLEACRRYPGAHNARRITFEYVMLKGVNDSLTEARELVRLVRGIPAKINLIPFNPWPGSPYTRSSSSRIQAFADVVVSAGYSSPVRRPRGQDILAACGQLKSATQKMRRGPTLQNDG